MTLFLISTTLLHKNIPFVDVNFSFYSVPSAYLTPHVLSKTALTQGQWCVHDKIWYDEKNRFVYFHGYREDPLENHLYVVSLDQPLNVVRLTDLGCSHSVQINTVSSAKNYINQIKYLAEIMASMFIKHKFILFIFQTFCGIG